jgi:hypothetical protein
MQCLKRYLRGNNVAEFREFYVPAGGGSNFLAKQCLWADAKDEESVAYGQDDTINEFRFRRQRVDIGWRGRYNLDYNSDDEDLISETKRIKPILIELDKWINNSNVDRNKDFHIHNSWAKPARNYIIDDIDNVWRRDFSPWTIAFYHFEHFLKFEPSQNVKDMVTSVQDYFAKCREYYFKVCEQHGHNSFLISHNHLYEAISPRFQLPKNFKSLAIELDPITEMMCTALNEIKSNQQFLIRKQYPISSKPVDELYANKYLKFADDKVSYRRIFFENDRIEIMKMYEFFDNKAYFHKNTVQIMKEFKEYHDNNMKVMKKFIPKHAKKINNEK